MSDATGFPEVFPEIAIEPRPEAELREVVRRDCNGIYLALEPQATGSWAFYDFPEAHLREVHEGWVAGRLKYRGRNCLEILDRNVHGESAGSWERDLLHVRPRTVRHLYSQDHFYFEDRLVADTAGPSIGPPQPRELALGDTWTERYEGFDGETLTHNVVDGPFELALPAGGTLCLRVLSWTSDQSSKQVRDECYVSEEGRTLVYRRFVSPGWLEYPSHQDLARSPACEHNGEHYLLQWVVLSELALLQPPAGV